jgi:hypothetical protein
LGVGSFAGLLPLKALPRMRKEESSPSSLFIAFDRVLMDAITGKGLVKLAGVVSGALGKWYEPIHIKRLAQAKAEEKLVAVGTVVTHRPPHRSVRAELLHTAPTKGVDVKPLRRMRMEYLARRQVSADHTAEP